MNQEELLNQMLNSEDDVDERQKQIWNDIAIGFLMNIVLSKFDDVELRQKISVHLYDQWVETCKAAHESTPDISSFLSMVGLTSDQTKEKSGFKLSARTSSLVRAMLSLEAPDGNRDPN